MSRRRVAGGLLLLILALAGCAPAGDRARAAAATAVRFLRAVGDGDGAAACAMLAPGTAEELERSGERPCAEAILAAGLPGPGAAGETSVYGQWAQVRLTGDTVFLATFPGGWRVVAAGCTPRGDRPYDCTVAGG